MARRNLLAEAQVQAQAQVAPQLAALGEALRQARTDRNAAIHTAAAASKGIGRAINRSQGTLKRAYKDTANLGAPGQSYSSGAYAGAAANERAVTGTVLASSLANALKEGSDRRIEAAAGRAYRVAATESAYGATVAGLQTKRQALAAQEGLLTGAAFSKLTEAAAGRKNQRILQSQRLGSQATLQSERLASQEAVAGARLRSSEHTAALGRRQQKLGRINQGKLQSQRLAAKTGPGAAPIKPSKDQIAATTNYFKAIQGYETDGKQKIAMRRTAANYDKEGIPRPITNAAADYYTKGHITPKSAQELAALGVVVPKSHIGVQVRAHTRKRR